MNNYLDARWLNFKEYREMKETQYYMDQSLFCRFSNGHEMSSYVEDYDKLLFIHNTAKQLQSSRLLEKLYSKEKEHKTSITRLVKRWIDYDEQTILRFEYIPKIISKIKLELKNDIGFYIGDKVDIEELIKIAESNEHYIKQKIITLLYFITFASKIKGVNIKKISKVLNVTPPSMDSLKDNYPLNFPVKCECCGIINYIKGINKNYEISPVKCECGHCAAGTFVTCDCSFCLDKHEDFNKNSYIDEIVLEMLCFLDDEKLGMNTSKTLSENSEEKKSDYIIYNIGINKSIDTLIKLNPKSIDKLFEYVDKISQSGLYEEKNKYELIKKLIDLRIIYRVVDITLLKSVLKKEIEDIVAHRMSELKDYYKQDYNNPYANKVWECFIRMVENTVKFSYVLNEFYFNFNNEL